MTSWLALVGRSSGSRRGEIWRVALLENLDNCKLRDNERSLVNVSP